MNNISTPKVDWHPLDKKIQRYSTLKYDKINSKHYFIFTRPLLNTVCMLFLYREMLEDGDIVSYCMWINMHALCKIQIGMWFHSQERSSATSFEKNIQDKAEQASWSRTTNYHMFWQGTFIYIAQFIRIGNSKFLYKWGHKITHKIKVQ